MSNYFSIEIYAPEGLTGIESYLPKCLMVLQAYKCQYNDKTILKSKINTDYEWSMDSSDTDKLFAAGEFYNGASDSINKLQSLSEILVSMNAPHQILIDNESSFLMKKISYNWPVM